MWPKRMGETKQSVTEQALLSILSKDNDFFVKIAVCKKIFYPAGCSIAESITGRPSFGSWMGMWRYTI